MVLSKATLEKMNRFLEEIAKGIPKHQLEEFGKELIKMYPNGDSQVSISTDYDEEKNSVGFSIFVSNPKEGILKSEIEFDQFFMECLKLSYIDQLKNIYECVELMERKEGNLYDLDFIPVFYNDELNKYYLHGRITKKK